MYKLDVYLKERDNSKYLYFVFFIFLVWLASTLNPLEAVRASDTSGYMKDIPEVVSVESDVPRVATENTNTRAIGHIRSYLVEYGSPHPELSETIVMESAKYGVNPYVITAIACQESSCFKSCYKNNCTGYGIGDSGMYGKVEFDSSEEAMAYMIKAYSENPRGYRQCDADIRCIGYSGYNARDSWVENVSYFYKEISQ